MKQRFQSKNNQKHFQDKTKGSKAKIIKDFWNETEVPKQKQSKTFPG